VLVVEIELPGMKTVTATGDAVLWSWTHAESYLKQLMKRNSAAASTSSAATSKSPSLALPDALLIFLERATVVTVHSDEKVHLQSTCFSSC
jgi:hypothetical protein